MASTVLLCTDGSVQSLAAITAGRALLAPDTPVALVTVSDAPDPADAIGAGFDGPAISPEELERETDAAEAEARAILRMAAAALDLTDAATYVVHGHSGQAICNLAAELAADGIVMGSRGHGGVTRAVLGSVSDYVIRHAPCPVVVTTQPGPGEPGQT